MTRRKAIITSSYNKNRREIKTPKNLDHLLALKMKKAQLEYLREMRILMVWRSNSLTHLITNVNDVQFMRFAMSNINYTYQTMCSSYKLKLDFKFLELKNELLSNFVLGRKNRDHEKINADTEVARNELINF